MGTSERDGRVQTPGLAFHTRRWYVLTTYYTYLLHFHFYFHSYFASCENRVTVYKRTSHYDIDNEQTIKPGYTKNSNANWNGTEFIQRSGHSIVFVNFNYRVGLWGFLAGERVRADGDLNAGLLDQRFMMQWVRQHIAQFGGDPDHVVVHGASAGAGSVALHLVAYGGNASDSESGGNLFAGAVGESVFFPAQPFVGELEWQLNLTLQRTGCDDDDDDAMTCLRSKSVEEVQAANVQETFPRAPVGSTPLFFWTPCIDGDLLRDLPYLLFERGQFLDVPVIMGTTTNGNSLNTSMRSPQARNECLRYYYY